MAAQIQLTTGKAEIGYDEKKKDMVFGFVRHENDAQGREVVENRARVQGIHGRDRFRSNDAHFADGAMALRCEAARTSKMVMERFGRMSAQGQENTTMDRVLPFQNSREERTRARRLQRMEHDVQDGRTGIHSAASAAAGLAAKKEQKQRDFRVKFAKATAQAKKNTHTEDYQLYLKKKWEEMRREALAQGAPDSGAHISEDTQNESRQESGERQEQAKTHNGKELNRSGGAGL